MRLLFISTLSLQCNFDLDTRDRIKKLLSIHCSLLSNSKPSSPLENIKHHQRYQKHTGHCKIESPFMMCIGDDIEVHTEYATYHCCRCQQAGHDGHYFHHLVETKIYIAYIQVLHAHHYIPIVFTEVERLYYVIIYIFEVFGSTIIEQFALASDDTTNKVAYRGNVSFKYDQFFTQLINTGQ